jgi:glycosyltransferase involved in cell wall biosynthesis
VPVEAMACGSPVVALGRGGAAETVVPAYAGPEATGAWFEEQDAECLAEAILAFERDSDALDPAAARRQALRFSPDRYERQLCAFLDGVRAGSEASAPGRAA